MPSYRDFSRQLRKDQTDAERALWQQLRSHRFMELKFKRQKVVGHYIVDFICLERMLVSNWTAASTWALLPIWSETPGSAPEVSRCYGSGIMTCC